MHLDNDYSNLLFQTKISFWLRALFSVSGFAILMIGILFLFEGKIIEGSISLVGEVLIYFIQKVFKVREDDFRNKATKKSKYLEIGNMWNLAVQGIDGALSVSKKVKVAGQAGPTEKYVLWPTRDITKNKINWMTETGAIHKKISQFIKPRSPEDYVRTELLRQIDSASATFKSVDLLRRPGIQASLKNIPGAQRAQLVESARQMRLLYDDIWKQMNTVRAQLGKSDISYLEKYSPEQIRDMNVWGKTTGFKKKINDIMSKKAPLPDYVKPNAPFNPRAMARENGIPYEEQEMSSIKLMEDYIVTASREMFNTPIIENNKVFIEQLRSAGLNNSADLLDRWTAEAYANISPTLDRWLNLPGKAKKGVRLFNQARNLGVFAWNFGWSLITQIQSQALTFGRYGGVNTFKGMFEWISNPALRNQTAKDYYSYMVKSQKQGRVTTQDVKNMIGEEIKISKSIGDLADDVGFFIIYEMEKLLTGSSIRAAYLDGFQKGLRGRALQEYASDGGAKTQSMYNDEDRPGVLRNLLVKTGAPFQTYAYEMVNTCREWGGQVGTPPDDTLDRTKMILRFLVATAALQTFAWKVGKRKFWMFDPLEMPLPFSEMWLAPIIATTTGKWRSPTYSLVSPVQTAADIGFGMRDVIQTGSWRRLRRVMLRYGPGLFKIGGGGMLERIVDSLIAYSQGGIKDRKGKIIAPVSDAWDVGKMIMFGSRAVRPEKEDKSPDTIEGILKEFETDEIEFDAESVLAEFGV